MPRPVGQALLDFDSRPEFAQFVLAPIGLRCVVEEEQLWRVAGHELRVCLWLDRRAIYVVLVRSGWLTPPAARSLTLTDVFAISATGKLRRLRGPALAVWKRIALIAARLLEPEPVCLPPLPPDAPRSVLALWQLLLPRYLEAREPGAPFPLVASFLEEVSQAVGCPMPATEIQSGRERLERAGWLVRAGTAPGRYGRPTQLWHVRPEFTFDEDDAPRSTVPVSGAEPEPLAGTVHLGSGSGTRPSARAQAEECT
jgi:hypothetical protein